MAERTDFSDLGVGFDRTSSGSLGRFGGTGTLLLYAMRYRSRRT